MPIPDVILQLGAAAAVIYVTVRFLAELRAMGKSRDKERQLFIGAIVSVVNLAQQMVNRCQGDVAPNERISLEDVLNAGIEPAKRKGG